MDPRVISVIEHGVAASLAGTHSFGEHVMALVAHGVESYRVDFRQRRCTYFIPSGASHEVALTTPAWPIADAFDADAIRAAVLGAQQGRVMYPEFVERAMRAGCVSYTVWIAGRHVAYCGRRGETHIERFPDSAS